MNRFRKYRVVKAFHNIRMIERYRLTEEATHNPALYLYRVQSHRRFLGISYWKTLVKTTSCKIAKDAYNLMVWDEKIGF